MRLKKPILSIPVLADVFQYFPKTYLVGGFLRDLILRRKPFMDFDFAVIGNPFETARFFTDRYSGSLVELQKDETYRVVLKDGATLDFSTIQESIEHDLFMRDFTINSLAWNPKKGLLDRTSGIKDLKAGIIRANGEANLIDDPLRILRAYRFMSELGFAIHRTTRQWNAINAGYLILPAKERITAEIYKLLDGPNYSTALKLAFKDGVLDFVISSSFDELKSNISNACKIDERLKAFQSKRFTRNLIDEKYQHGISYAGLLRLESLLIGSELSNSKIAPSGRIAKKAEKVNALLPNFKKLRKAEGSYALFASAGDALFDLIILSGREKFLDKAIEFVEIKKRSFLSSKEIMSITGLDSGAELGGVIDRLKALQFDGVIRNRADALDCLNKPDFIS